MEVRRLVYRGGMTEIIIRRLGQIVCVGNDIEITVLAIKGDEVRLGIDAPKSAPVERKETVNRNQ